MGPCRISTAFSGYREYYLRDAQGNVMAMYKYTNPGSASLKVTERPVYGSSRLGSYTRPLELVGEQAITTYHPYIQPMQAPWKHYELTDHLGNVATVVTGRLLPGNGAGSTYQAEVVSAQGYEPFGALLPGRNYSSSTYRYGLNGQDKDDEIYGATGTSYTAEFWQYDSRVAHRWNMDPVIAPQLSPYAPFVNNPIYYKDPDGDCPWCFVGAALDYGLQVYGNYKDGKTGYDAWVGDVNFVSVGVSAIPGGGSLLGTVAKEALSSTVRVTPNSGVTVETDVSKIAKETAQGVVLDKVGDRVTTRIRVSTSDEAVAAAQRNVSQANQQVRKAENAAVRRPNSPKAAEAVGQAQAAAQQARNSQVRTQMGNAVPKQALEIAVDRSIREVSNAVTGSGSDSQSPVPTSTPTFTRETVMTF